MVDGLSIVYNLFKFISAQGIEQAYSYYYVKKHLFQFLDYLDYRGLEIAYFCVDSIMQDDKIIITLSGQDKIGIVARLTTALAEYRVNIEDIKQTIGKICAQYGAHIERLLVRF